MRAGIIGAGKLGTALGKHMVLHGTSLAGYASRTISSAEAAAAFTGSRAYGQIGSLLAECDTLFLTVPDGAIAPLWRELASEPLHGKTICHCSGALSSLVFEDIGETGAQGFSVHPLFAAHDRFTAHKGLEGAYFTVEGTGAGREALCKWLRRMGNPCEVITSGNKTLYHATCVMVSNLAVGLAQLGANLLGQCGLEADFCEKAWQSLFLGNAHTLCEKGPVQALTGPVERGDTGTVQKHLEALSGPEREVYRLLSLTLVQIAEQKHPGRDYHPLKEVLYPNNDGRGQRPHRAMKHLPRKETEPVKKTVVTFQQQKQSGEKITMLTGYDYSTAKLMDEAGIDCILVGDSLGMVMLGYQDTLPVTMEDMIHHTRAVARGVKNAMVVADLPFMSYQTSVYDAVFNAGRLMKEGRAAAVKLEGGREFFKHIRAITNASVPVVGHLGLTPQSVHAFGGYRVQGRDEAAARKLVDDALAVQEAGAFAVVLECVPADLAAHITKMLRIPTIGIGGGAGCDGQVLVYQDMLAMYSDMKPKFVKQFANVGELMKQAFHDYIEETRSGAFPAPEHSYAMDGEILKKVISGGQNGEEIQEEGATADGGDKNCTGNIRLGTQPASSRT